MKQMLEDVRVLDFSETEAGAGAAGMMADHGARVIKIERPGKGDPVRAMAPRIDGVSLTHCWQNRGKKSVVIDLGDDEGAVIVKKMIADCDVIIETATPGFMDGIGLGYAEAAKIKPDIIYCAITPFGQKGPYSKKQGNDLIAQAMSGHMELVGETKGAPRRHGFPFGDYLGSDTAYGAIVTSLCNREFTGEGQFIDVAMVRSLIWINSGLDRCNVNIFSKREGNHHISLSPFGLFNGKNGQSAIICALNPKIWESLCDTIGKPELKKDPRFINVSSRVSNRYEVVAILEDWLCKFENIEEAAALLEKANVPSCQVNTAKDVLANPHFNAVNWFIRVETPESITSTDTYLTHNMNAVFSKAPGVIKKAPDLGRHTIEVLEQYGLSKENIEYLQNKWNA
jgi:crotonobetainyl-CoA:carnitine CoA-transferase CaiB-like acyl-CoA transferase